MRRALAILGTMLLAGCLGATAQQVQTIDRIIATVNKQPLLLSDWESSVRMEAFLQQKDAATFSEKERKAVLERLIDRELLMQQMQADYSPTSQDVKNRVNSIRGQFGVAQDDQKWNVILGSHGITQADLDSFLRMQLQVLRFVDLRLRPTIRIDDEAIQAYYRDTLVPEVKRAGAEPEPLQQVRPRIREILVQQKMDGVLESWLTNLRSQSDVHMSKEAEVSSVRAVPGGGVQKDTQHK